MADGRRPVTTARDTRARIVGTVASVIRFVGALGALVLSAHVLLTVAGADPTSTITVLVRDGAHALALGFQNLFAPADPTIRVLVNYGLAAAFWLVVSRALGRLVLSLA